jgi:molybdenum cofactor cytidylyltransferase
MEIGSIILSGGRSSRMGTPKALIKIKDLTFLEIIINKHHEAGIKIPVVLISDFLEAEVSKLGLSDIDIIVCSPPEKTSLDSLKRGIRHLDHDLKGFIVHPIDFPLPSIETIKMLIAGFFESGKAIVKPVYDGKGGHPIISSTSLIGEIMDATEDSGLRQVVRKDKTGYYHYRRKIVG